jgi:tRNA (cytidine32/uridine32-2'-O)-methyltransferase
LVEKNPSQPNDAAPEEVSCVQSNVKFIFCRPYYLGNIGSIARAMKNFAFSNLILVQPPHNYKDAEARMMAVGAFDLLKSCKVQDALAPAIEDAALVYGTSSGRQRAQNLISLQEAAKEAAIASHDNIVAFVFGDEKNGLETEELARCHRLVHIQTNPDFPAMNLAQAACATAYELTRANQFGVAQHNTPPKYTRRQLPTVADENDFFTAVEEFFQLIDFTRPHNKQVVLDDLRRLYQRSSPTKRELDLVRSALYRLNSKIRKD